LLQEKIQCGEIFFLVYSVDDKASFIIIDEYFSNIKRNCIKNKPHIILLGSQLNGEEFRKISIQEGKEKAQKFGADFFENSIEKNFNDTQNFEEDILSLKAKKKRSKSPTCQIS
jgi:hypothetical protein